MVGLLIEAYESGSALEESFRYVAGHGPAIAREDFEWALAQLNTGKSREQVLTAMSDRRRDPILDVIVESLLVQDDMGKRPDLATGAKSGDQLARDSVRDEH